MADGPDMPETLRDAFLASLDWWEEAGVGEHVSDRAGGWLRTADTSAEAAVAVSENAAPPPVQEPARKPAHARFIETEPLGNHPGDPAQWPGDLAAFQKWWMESDLVDPAGAFPRIAPSGGTKAPVMVIIDQPAGDALLEGAAAKLLDNMLRAMAFAPEAAYRASILPRHTLRPEWNAIEQAGYGKLLLHQIALAQPACILGIGNRVWSLLAHETAQEPAALTKIAMDSGTIPVFAIPDLATMLRNPRSRAETWNRWLDWSDRP
ncbi:hypothetical protein [Alteriqipengyuania sp.]|uniref:hypothetical protein n=1 Tax=Alteriqipengyuania sp. TaxID=2800692 RepID=UPI0035126FD3